MVNNLFVGCLFFFFLAFWIVFVNWLICGLSFFQLRLCKEREKKETALKNEALKEKAFLQQLLRVKTEVNLL